MAFLVALAFFIWRTLADPDFAGAALAVSEGVAAGAGVSANSKSLRKNDSGHVTGVLIIFFMTISLYQSDVCSGNGIDA
jgi:hypothetical protein